MLTIETPETERAREALCRVTSLPSIFTIERQERHVSTGQTVAEIMAEVGCRPGREYYVLLNGECVVPEQWSTVRPRPGDDVVIRRVPLGGGGGGDSNKTLRTILQVVVVVVALVIIVATSGSATPGVLGLTGAAWGAIAATAVTVVGNLALAALLPPKFDLPRGDERAPLGYSLSGSRNQARPGGAVPRVYGRMRVFPFYGARPFTELVGDEQDLIMVFTAGDGPLQITDLKIGDTPLANFQGVQTEIREGAVGDAPLTLYPGTVIEDAVQVRLRHGVPEVRTVTNADAVSIDLINPGGVYRRERNGKLHEAGWFANIETSPAGAGTWTLRESVVIRAASDRTIRRGSSKITLSPRGDYDVRVTRMTSEPGGELFSESWWSVVRGFTNEDPIAEPGMSKIAVRLRATEQLNGVVDTFNFLAEAKLRTWNGSAWDSTPAVTRNPAAAYLDLLTGTINKRPVADARVDLAGLGAWYAACETAGRHYDAFIDYRTTVFQALHEAAVAGRAAFSMPNGKYGVVRDVLQATPVQAFTPRNSWGFTARKLFPDRVDGFKMPFLNEEKGYQRDELIVYDDGVDPETADLFEILELPGITDPDHLYKEGRYHMAVARLRPEVWEVTADPEHIICQRGDLVDLQHDVLLVGLAAGRVKSVTVNGSNDVTAVTVDELVTMETGTDYGIRFRRQTGAFVSTQVTTVDGVDQGSISFVTPIPNVGGQPAIAKGDLYYFGVLGSESTPALVKLILPGRDQTARLQLVPAAPAVHDADGGAIPPFDPDITIPPELRAPPAPLVDAVNSDGSLVSRLANGTLGSRISVHWYFASGLALDGARVQVWYRPSGLTQEQPWARRSDVDAEAHAATIEPLQPGTTYDVRLRTVSRYNVMSPTVTIFNVQLPAPPVYTQYVLTPTLGGYLATLGEQAAGPRPPVVTGLRLVNSASGHPNDTDFVGRDAKITWNAMSLGDTGDAEDDLTQDNELRDYVVEVLTGGASRQSIATRSPGYTYFYEANLEDHAGSPSRTITFRVWARGHDGQLSPYAAEITVENPAPDMSQVLPIIVPTFDGLNISWAGFAATDHDMESYDVLIGTSSPPTTLAASRAAQQREVFLSGLPSGVEQFVQILPRDAFGAGVASQIASATPLSVNAIDLFLRSFSAQGIQFLYDPETSSLGWTGGDLSYTTDGTTTTTRTIATGAVEHAGGTTFVYYILGESIFRTTNSLVVAIGADRNVMATYTGGHGLTVNWGKVVQHGGDILANTIGAGQIVLGTAVITQAAQIANALITNAHIISLVADKITAGNIVAQLVMAAGSIIAGNPVSGHVLLNNDGVYVRDNSLQTVAFMQKSTPFLRIGRAGGAVPPLELSSAGDLKEIVAQQVLDSEIGRTGEATFGSDTITTNEGTSVTRTFATFSSLVSTKRASDKVMLWFAGSFSTNSGAGGVAYTITMRLKRGSTVILTYTISRDNTVGAGEVDSQFIRDWTVDVPGSVGNVTYTIEAVLSAVGAPTPEISGTLSSVKLLAWAKSA